jgi:hypothetical protein
VADDGLKVTIVLPAASADLLYQAVRSGAVAWSLQGKDDDARRALALAEQIKGARRYRHGGSARQSTRLLRRG